MDVVTVKAYLPSELKRQAFAALAWQEISFSQWVRDQLEIWLQQHGWSTPVHDVLHPDQEGAMGPSERIPYPLGGTHGPSDGG